MQPSDLALGGLARNALGSPSNPFASAAERDAWAAANLGGLTVGDPKYFLPGPIRCTWAGPGSRDWEYPDAVAVDGPVRFATFGDSYDAYGGGNTDTEIMNLDFPGSGTSDYQTGQNVLGGVYTLPAIMVANGGIAGQNTTQMLARGAGAYSATRRALSDVAAKKPHCVLIRGCSINDIMFYTSATSISLIDAVYTRMMQAINFFTARGIKVVQTGIYGINNGSVVTLPAQDLASVRGYVLYLNDKFKAAANLSKGMHLFLDPSGVIHDGTGAIISGLSVDGVHLNSSAGAAALTNLESATLRGLFRPVNPLKTILWDEQSNYANASSGNPANTTFTTSGLTIASKTCDAEKHTLNITVTDYTTAVLGKYWQNMVSQILGSLAANKGLAFLFDYELRDSNGNLVYNNVTVSQVLLRNSDNTKSAKYDKAYGSNQNAPFLKQFSTPVDGSLLGTNTSFFVLVNFPANGNYVLTFRPSVLIEYA